MRKSIIAPLLIAVSLFAARAATAHGIPSEIAELRRRVAAIRADLPNVTAAADYATDIFTRDPAARFLFSATRSPALFSEFAWHTGASPEMRNADDAAARGVVVYPVAAWESNGLTVAMLLDRWQSAGRPVIVIGSTADKPTFSTLRWLITNGAPDGSRANAAINGVANMIAAWTLYVEFVASATRHHWQPGIYVSNLVPEADDSNYRVRFRVPAGAVPVTPIPAGELGTQYLDRIDSLLTVAARPRHVTLVQRAADSLRTVRAAGHRLFVAGCADYLSTFVVTDTAASSFRPWNGREGAAPELLQAQEVRANDGVLWFGYAGYDCPHVQPSQPFQDAGVRVVVVSDRLLDKLPANVMVAVPLGWQLPEHIGKVPFDPEGVGSASSVDAALHYLWIRRLVATR
jgi:hypothetical protein